MLVCIYLIHEYFHLQRGLCSVLSECLPRPAQPGSFVIPRLTVFSLLFSIQRSQCKSCQGGCFLHKPSSIRQRSLAPSRSTGLTHVNFYALQHVSDLGNIWTVPLHPFKPSQSYEFLFLAMTNFMLDLISFSALACSASKEGVSNFVS